MPMKKIVDWDTQKKALLSETDTLHELSKDEEHDEYLTDSKVRALDFDKIKRGFTQVFHVSEDGFHSVDAILQDKTDDVFYFIEFKNGAFDPGREVVPKIPDTIILFADIMGLQIAEIRDKCEFILAYNVDAKPFTSQEERDLKIHRYLYDRAERENVRFGMRRFKNTYFRDVHTYTEDQFEEFLRRNVGKF